MFEEMHNTNMSRITTFDTLDVEAYFKKTAVQAEMKLNYKQECPTVLV